MRCEVDAAQAVEPRPPAPTLFGKAPEQDRRLAYLGQLQEHAGIGEGDLQHQQPLERDTSQRSLYGRQVNGGIDQHGRARGLDAESGQRRQRLFVHRLRQRHIEGVARDRNDADHGSMPG